MSWPSTAATQSVATEPSDQSVEGLAERLFAAALGTADLFAFYPGDGLGWYDALAAGGALTPEELAKRTGTHPRYAPEWLEQQAVTGLLTHIDGRFELPAPAAEVLTNRHSLNYLAPVARMFVAAAGQFPALLRAYREGGGVSWSQLGPDARESQADMSRPWFEHAVGDALTGAPEVAEVLSRPWAHVLDIGCGAAWSSIALARAFPSLRVTAVDVDAPSVELARRNIADAGLADRVMVAAGDTASAPPATFDMAFAFECIHDMPRPVEVLAAARRALRPGGSVVVMDEAVGEDLQTPGDDLERLMYGFSLLICLPDGMSQTPSAATGTVMRPARLQYAAAAVFADTTVLSIQDFGFWRFYRLTT